MSLSVCKQCGLPIIWLTLSNGEKVPLDPDKIPFVARGENGKHQEFEGRVPHWATCPNPIEVGDETTAPAPDVDGHPV